MAILIDPKKGVLNSKRNHNSLVYFPADIHGTPKTISSFWETPHFPFDTAAGWSSLTPVASECSDCLLEPAGSSGMKEYLAGFVFDRP